MDEITNWIYGHSIPLFHFSYWIWNPGHNSQTNTNVYMENYVWLHLYRIHYIVYLSEKKIRCLRQKYEDALKNKRDSGEVHYTHQVTRTVSVLIAAATTCYMPWLITKVVSFYFATDENTKVTQTIWLISYIFMILMFLSAGFNSVIILHRNKTLKNYVLTLIRKGQIEKTGENEEPESQVQYLKRQAKVQPTKEMKCTYVTEQERVTACINVRAI